ncbi:MAG: hypothetical protein WAZ98_00235 [Cyclobacteriaceae bacterium]
MKQKRTKRELAKLKEAHEQQMKAKAEIERLYRKFPNGILTGGLSEEEVRKHRKELLKQMAFQRPYAELGVKFYKNQSPQKPSGKKRKPNAEKVDRAKSIIERENPTKQHISSCRGLAEFLNKHSQVGDNFTKDWVNKHLKSFIKK